jgi:hypothetical protein
LGGLRARAEVDDPVLWPLVPDVLGAAPLLAGLAGLAGRSAA